MACCASVEQGVFAVGEVEGRRASDVLVPIEGRIVAAMSCVDFGLELSWDATLDDMART